MSSSPLPCRLLQAVDDKWPLLWETADRFRHARKPDWDPAVFMPLVHWQDLMRSRLPEMETETRIGLTHLVSSIGAWRLTQDIVRFDPEMFTQICESRFCDPFPVDLLGRLPAWGMYIEAPQIKLIDMAWDGFFATFDAFQNPVLKFLRLLFVDEKFRSCHYIIPLKGSSLHGAFAAVNMQILLKYGKGEGETRCQKLENGIFQAISLLSFVCSSWSRGEAGKAHATARRGAANAQADAWRFVAPVRPAFRMPGIECEHGALTHPSQSIGIRSSPRPHIRRAHWQRCWSGPADDRKLISRWIPPTPVAMGNGYQKKISLKRKSKEKEMLT